MTKEENKQDWKDRERGALWLRESNGKKYFTGYFEKDGVKTELYVSKNDFREGDENKPYFRIFESKPFNKEAGAGATAVAATTTEAAPENDDVPF